MGVRVPPFAHQLFSGKVIMDCDTYCTALSYDTKALFSFFNKHYEAEVIDKIVYVAYQREGRCADLFFFPYGTFVAWDLSEENVSEIIEAIKPFETTSLAAIEHEHHQYRYGEKIIYDDAMSTLPSGEMKAKLAFSHGFAQSAKLSVFEKLMQMIYEENKYLPESLARYGKIPLSRSQIRKKLGQLFLDRTSINLHLGVLDAPDFFWDNSDFEPLYKKMTIELELRSRTGVLNQQLGILHDLFEMLSQQLSDQHASRLEWVIIWLIVIEVLILLFHDVMQVI